ncbi:F-box/FBD/LRR-repeat protein At1g78750-like [Papaver somniferum]|uniref:F-box/FBD/LRR-repeat protein At1g78750-like n=1 Tax=Papaver somniferum TaxID=3469 RepID=UPI000E6FE02A|nr:F-box/FBD/LRR-repeat protein At1g78750-like [Papaver somniferum]
MSTCVLSKRWKCVSNSIPTLDFRGCEAGNRTVKEKRLKTQQFMDFLDTVLCLHEKPNIQKFYLSWDEFFNPSRVNKWISIVIKRKVEELFLSVPSETYYFIFPLSLFTCDSLAVLELDLDGLRLNVPTTISFPRLKLLRLRRMKFVNGISIEKLVSKCPILEELSLRDCRGLESEVLCIANLALKNLYISHWHFRESTLKICSPNLSTISYGYLAPADFVIDNFSSLVEADIDITFFKNDGSEKFILIELLKKLASVKLLKIFDWKISCLVLSP